MSTNEANTMISYWNSKGVTGLRLLDPKPVGPQPVTSSEALKEFCKLAGIAEAHGAKKWLTFGTVTMDTKLFGQLSKFQKWEVLYTHIMMYKDLLNNGEIFAGYVEYTKQHVPHFHFVTNAGMFYKFKEAFGPLGKGNRTPRENFKNTNDLIGTWNYISKDQGAFFTNIER